MAVGVLAVLHGDDPLVHQMILEMATDPHHSVRNVAVGATTRMPLDECVTELLRGVVTNWSDDSFSTSLAAIGIRGAEGAVFLDDVRELMLARNIYLYAAADCYRRIGGDPHLALEVLLEEFEPGRPVHSTRRVLRLDLFSTLGITSNDACMKIAPLLHDDDIDVRSAAALAYAALGGEDIETATRTILDAAAAGSGRVTSRWVQFAANGRFSYDVLRGLIHSDNPIDRTVALSFLEYANEAAAPLQTELRLLLNDPNPQIQAEAAKVLRRLEYLLRQSSN